MGPFNNIAMKQAVHLLNLTDKGRFQPVLTAGYGSNSYSMLRERTNAGTTALYDLIRRSGVKQSGLGREGLRDSIREMTEPRLLVLRQR